MVKIAVVRKGFNCQASAALADWLPMGCLAVFAEKRNPVSIQRVVVVSFPVTSETCATNFLSWRRGICVRGIDSLNVVTTSFVTVRALMGHQAVGAINCNCFQNFSFCDLCYKRVQVNSRSVRVVSGWQHGKVLVNRRRNIC